jgi:DNA-binding CsgD family transcriptional regulator
MEEALRLFERAPPSFEHADALLDYASIFLLNLEGRLDASVPALYRALEVAETVGATALIPRILSVIAFSAFVQGQVEDGFANLDRGWELARAAQDGVALLWLAINDSDARLKLARFQHAAEVALRGLDAARQVGLEATSGAMSLVANAAEALLAQGRTAEAAALAGPLTTGPPGPSTWLVHRARAQIDLLRGDAIAAAGRWQLISALPAIVSRADFAYEASPWAAEVALWAGRPHDALQETRRALTLFTVPDLALLSGRLLTAGMRACADLAEQAQARHDDPATAAAMTAADGLVTWTEQMAGAPFTDHPFVAIIPAERATWDAEQTRLAGPSDPGAWSSAAKAWQDLGCPHRAAYAWWRQAQALLDGGQPRTVAVGPLRAAAASAAGHVPLLAQIGLLAQRARIELQPPAPVAAAAPAATASAAYGLTRRELAVLRLLAAGRTNAQIGAELYISPKTAGVHVTSILRKLGVAGRVQAAAVAERAGLLQARQP